VIYIFTVQRHTESILIHWSEVMMRETMEFDVIIVGAGPAGLAAAIRLKQRLPTLRVCVLEKGAEVGAHILSGAAFEPRALNELLPDWQTLGAPLNTPATADHFWLLSKNHRFPLPVSPSLQNHGNYIISLSNLCRWLGKQAEALGIEIYPGFAATEILYNDNNCVIGVATGDMGVNKQGEQTAHYQPGMALLAKYTLLAEGCRGSLTEAVIAHFKLRQTCQPQTYGIGIKEVWEVDPKIHKPGTVIHTVGWPLDNSTYGGSFLYHFDNGLVAVGFVTGLDYRNPYLSPFEEFQRFKNHPHIAPTFKQGKRICYGARALNEGGLQAIPKLSFPGGLLIGDAAGFLNVAKIKGSHTAMKSGMLAADSIADSWPQPIAELTTYTDKIKSSWVWQELYRVRNIRPGFHYGLWAGLAYAALDTYLLRGHAPWTFKHHVDHACLKHAADCEPIIYPKPDGVLTFDKMSSVFLSNTLHEENQPTHLQLKNPQTAIAVNLALYDCPEQRYCPAGVYEIVTDTATQQPYLQINAANCVHCKTCDIKDPTQNIVWVPPEGGGGPQYSNM
jgi:electron-transferring-flavoprotein dehydrogenase